MAIKDAGTMADQISSAIGVHGLWKSRVINAIATGTSEWHPAFVAPCGNCEFGIWLDGFEDADKDRFYEEIYKLHAGFHVEAARVLQLALSGKKDEAQAAIDDMGPYVKLTTGLTLKMIKWHGSIAA